MFCSFLKWVFFKVDVVFFVVKDVVIFIIGELDNDVFVFWVVVFLYFIKLDCLLWMDIFICGGSCVFEIGIVGCVVLFGLFDVWGS